jgi:hypothetical protein
VINLSLHRRYAVLTQKRFVHVVDDIMPGRQWTCELEKLRLAEMAPLQVSVGASGSSAVGRESGAEEPDDWAELTATTSGGGGGGGGSSKKKTKKKTKKKK